MKILLINPAKPNENYYLIPQIGLGYLSAALKSNGFNNVKIIDFQLLGIKKMNEVEEIFQKEKPDIIAIKLWSLHISLIKDYVKIIRIIFGDRVKIIIGGPHPSVAPKESISFIEGIDFGMGGESEESLPMLIKKISGNNSINYEDIPGLIWKNEKGEAQVNQFFWEENLDKYSIDWDSLNLSAYHKLRQRSPNFDYKKQKNGFLFCTRGCPYQCTYCSAGLISGKKVRHFSPALVIKDIHYLYKKYGIRHFNIMDDNFTFNREYVIKFCEEYLKCPLKDVTFSCPNGVRVDRIDSEMLSFMKKCGWIKLMVGIESGNLKILKLMKKNLDLNKIREGIKLINKYGIKTWGFFILGYPGENKETLRETIDFALNLPLTWASFSIFSPIPNTEIFYQLQADGRIPDDYNMADYHSVEAVYSEKLTRRDLLWSQFLAYFKFYSRPRKALNLFLTTSLSSLFKSMFSILKI